jgi:hypothetical protein
MNTRYFLFSAALVLLVLVSFLRGSRDERIVSLALVAAALLTGLVSSTLRSGGWAAGFAIDVCLSGFLAMVAMKSERYWPLFCAGISLNITLLHFLMLAGLLVHGNAYADMLVLFSYAVLIPPMVSLVDREEAPGR